MVGTTLSGAKLSGAYVYGVSAWDIKGTPEEQLNLVITRNTTPVTVDELEVAQFLHLVMDNQKITKPRAIQQELNATVPDLEIPFLPIIRQGEKPYSMFNDLQRKDWVLKLVSYKSSENLLKNFHKLIIKAERLHKVLLTEKSRQAVAATPIDELTE